jgi:hypothetical protein
MPCDHQYWSISENRQTGQLVGLPERGLTTQYVLQMTSAEILPILKEALVKLILRRRPLMTKVFVANITG